MAFMLGKNLAFIDSLLFMSNSLAQLDDNLHNDSFKYTGQTFKKDRQFQLMKQKGIYLYDYMDNSERFKETQLPPKKAFYSILNNEHITDAEYKHAQNVWKTFKLINMGFIVIFIWHLMCCCWLMCFRTSEQKRRNAYKILMAINMVVYISMRRD